VLIRTQHRARVLFFTALVVVATSPDQAKQLVRKHTASAA
jgi:hypothetical protein